MRRKNIYVHEKPGWPGLFWDRDLVMTPLGKVRNLQGRLMGKMESLGFELQTEAALGTLTLDVLKSSEIEGEVFEKEQVRSSLARKLGLEISGSVASERDVDGVVEMMLDATQHYDDALTAERLFGWHASLFPTGRSGMYKITTGDWRKEATGPMQVVSGAMGKEKVHFEAPDSSRVEAEMTEFLQWFETETTLDPVLKAAVAHFWFVTVHPFDDGNGRVARALTDMVLARSDQSVHRFYSMSAQIRVERKGYYDTLEKSQKGTQDITEWVLWFLNCLSNAIEASNELLSRVLMKAEFWKVHAKTALNERQTKLLNKLLDGFDGNLTTSKWAKIAKCSQDTALRDVQDLMQKSILEKTTSGGRSTNYELSALMEVK